MALVAGTSSHSAPAPLSGDSSVTQNVQYGLGLDFLGLLIAAIFETYSCISRTQPIQETSRKHAVFRNHGTVGDGDGIE